MPPVEELQRTALALPAKDRAALARQTALSLSEHERAALAHDLIASLDDEDDVIDEAEFMAEIERRSEEIRSGAVQPRECRVVMEELERDLREGKLQ
jgi:putative addiction module component (TIGR02574 family)